VCIRIQQEENMSRSRSDVPGLNEDTTPLSAGMSALRWKSLVSGFFSSLVVLTTSVSFGATITVTGSSDGTLAELEGNGTCDLREAIEASNTDAAVGECSAGLGLDSITFSIGNGQQTIEIEFDLPTIVDPAILDGTTQPGCDGAPCIVLVGLGPNQTETLNGLVVSAGGSTLRGLAIKGFREHGILITGTGGNVVEGNRVGPSTLEDNARWRLRNRGAGVYVDNSSGNLIGGTTETTRNVLSGNHSGVTIAGASSIENTVIGNYIGTDATGTQAIANERSGVRINGAGYNTIGGTAADERNVISGNGPKAGAPNDYRIGWGVLIEGDNPHHNRILGNYIGTDWTGTVALANDHFGVWVGGADNIVGGPQAGARNVVSGNGGAYFEWGQIGVVISGERNIVQGNYIGVDATGNAPLGNVWDGICVFDGSYATIGGVGEGEPNLIGFNGGAGVLVLDSDSEDGQPPHGNRIVGNSIFENGQLGIDLAVDEYGHTPNDSGDQDIGSNGFQNHPVLERVTWSPNSTEVVCTLNSTPDTEFAVHFYGSSAADPSGYGEGEVFLGELVVITDSAGFAQGTVSFEPTLATGRFVTATATDPAGNTSEFSNAVEIRREITVSSTLDGSLAELNGNGTCDLREAITAANTDSAVGECPAGSGLDTIAFDFGSTGLKTIRPASALPTLTDPVVIDGTTQLGCGTKPCIEIDGIDAGDSSGLTITAGSSTVRGFVINRFSLNGILISEGGLNTVEGNFIGVDATGVVRLANGGSGVYIEDSSRNTIGGSFETARNVISGNDTGVEITGTSADENVVIGNYIGTDKSGMKSLGNTNWGVVVDGRYNVIGGKYPGEGNVISGTGEGWATGGGVGLGISGEGHVIQGNLIGTDVTGKVQIGNTWQGIRVDCAQKTLIGGLERGSGNTIAFNGLSGVYIAGDESTGCSTSTHNRIVGNSIHSNSELGIDLAPDGVTANDVLDTDTGANTLQNYPVLSAAVTYGDPVVISGNLDSTSDTGIFIDFYANDEVDDSGYGEGQTYLGRHTITTGADGQSSFTVSFSVDLDEGQHITATATDMAGNTSEFSMAIEVIPADPIALPHGPRPKKLDRAERKGGVQRR
jgi:hypothetical protein